TTNDSSFIGSSLSLAGLAVAPGVLWARKASAEANESPSASSAEPRPLPLVNRDAVMVLLWLVVVSTKPAAERPRVTFAWQQRHPDPARNANATALVRDETKRHFSATKLSRFRDMTERSATKRRALRQPQILRRRTPINTAVGL